MHKALIAQIAHQIIASYSASIGDTSAPAWNEAPQAFRDGVQAGVDIYLGNPAATPEAAHAAWMDEKVAQGWKLGAKRDDKKKTSPSLVPYAELPEATRAKDHILRGAALALAALPEPEPQVVEKTVTVEKPVDLNTLEPQAIYAQLGVDSRRTLGEIFASLVPPAGPAPVMVAAGYQAVTYIGTRAQHVDRIYNTGLTFVPNQTRVVPLHVARKFLRHADLFEPGKVDADGAVVLDDTQFQMDQAAKDEAAALRTRNDRQDLFDRIQTMEPAGLVELAMSNYRIPLDAAKPVDALRADVIQLIDQYGVV